MKTKFILYILFCAVSGLEAQKYQYSLDLTETVDDKLKVELLAPEINAKSVVFYLPKTVPGTYSTDNYGRYIEQFHAFDKNGRNLRISRLNQNSWRIYKAKRVKKVSYWVNDSFDEVKDGSAIFEPAGSNIEKDKNYILNTHCFFGYFENRKALPFELKVKHQQNLIATTSLIDEDDSDSYDRFETSNYNRLVDSPIMYAAPNNSTIKIGDSEVVIGVYSPNNVIKAEFLAENLKKLLDAQVAYIGGMPVKKYAFIIYLADKPGLSGSHGALEHSYSSLYYLPEVSGEEALPFIMDVSAHEFFHILTPLNMHSEEIHYFDFNQPKMSKHLWLYEGSTEYHAHLAQVRYGLKSRNDFFKEMSDKVTASKTEFRDDLPFTVMSQRVLEEEYVTEYGNVYQKGALISMCLDLILRKNSSGKYGIIDLVNELSAIYGVDKPFKDDELFDQIEKIKGNEVRQFLDNYVAGSNPLPLKEALNWVGIDLIPEAGTGDSTVSLGSIGFGLNENQQLVITDVSSMNEFGKKIGYQKEDILLAINGKDAVISGFQQIIDELVANGISGQPLTVSVHRKVDGVLQKIDLTAPLLKLPVIKKNIFVEIQETTPGQRQLREAWLSAK